MPFSTKEKADYVEMINEELDSIPVEHPNEFKLIAEELQKMISWSIIGALKSRFFSPQKPALPQASEKQLNYVRYCLNTPQEFVKSSKDYAEYHQIITKRITAKINEFQSLDDKTMHDYLKFQVEKHQGTLLNVSV